MNAKKKKSKFVQKLLHKYRLVVLNEDTFDEKFSLRLTRLNVFFVAAVTTLILIVLTIFLIAFTPLREYIPGYSSTKLKKQATILSYKTDSLEKVIEVNEKYYASIKKVLQGEVEHSNFNKDSIIEAAKAEIAEEKITPNKQDSLLREKVEKEDKYNLFQMEQKENLILFPPVKGTISETYNPKEKHFAVDVVVVKNAPIKAVADGTVIFADWTTDTGHVILIEHKNNLISVYKHNASLHKEQGEKVKAGEVIAISGNTGELSTGPHLHFELWSNQQPINPTNFIDFE